MDSELISIIISSVASIASVFAAVIAAVELKRSRKSNEERLKRERKEATVNAYNNLQNQVLDKLVSISSEEIKELMKNIECEEFKKIYMDYKALIARCEHFAVGINENIYDFDVLYELSGEHLVYLYKKVEPIILHAREYCVNSVPFDGFEKMVIRLNNKNNKCQEK